MINKSILTFASVAMFSIHGSNASEVSYGGFVSNGYLKSSDNNYLADTEEGDFAFAEIGLNATWSPIDRTTVRGQLFTFELGPYGNFDPIVDYLFVDYRVNPAFGVRLGRVKRMEGIYTDIQDIDIARTSILLPTGMYDARYRDFNASVDGISLYGNFNAGNHSFEYTAYYGDITLEEDSGVAAYAVTAIAQNILNPELTNIEADTNAGLQLWWHTPVSGLRFGASYSYYDKFAIDVSGNIPYVGYPISIETIAGAEQVRLSAEYFWGDWTFVSEFHTQMIDSSLRNTIAGMPGEWSDGESTSEGWYVSASRRFLERFEAGVTLSQYYGNTEERDLPSSYQNDTQFSLRYNATDYWSLKTEIHFMEGTNRLFNQLGQNAGPLEDSWTLFAAKSTFSF